MWKEKEQMYQFTQTEGPVYFEKKSLTDNYKLQGELGKGNYGIVHLAQQNVTNKLVAIKELKTVNVKTINSVKQEVEMLKILLPTCHPNFLCYEDAFEDLGKIYLVTNYIKGFNLKDTASIIYHQFFETNKMLYYSIILSLLQDLLYILSVIHERNIVHGDIKPENIIVRRDISFKNKILSQGTTEANLIWQPVLIDFGLSCLATSPSCQKPAGTPLYMAPEIFVHGRRYPESDIWALGLCFYIILTGDVPWPVELKTVPDFKNYIINGNYKLDIATPNSTLDNTLNTMLNRDYMERSTAHDLYQQSLNS